MKSIIAEKYKATFILNETLSPMGTGRDMYIEGETKIKSSDRRKYQKGIGPENYYPSLSKLTDRVISALQGAGLEAIMSNDEEWRGGFTGALSAGETAQMRIDLAKDGQRVMNSLLILNIYKMEGSKLSYELNTYLS